MFMYVTFIFRSVTFIPNFKKKMILQIKYISKTVMGGGLISYYTTDSHYVDPYLFEFSVMIQLFLLICFLHSNQFNLISYTYTLTYRTEEMFFRSTKYNRVN